MQEKEKKDNGFWYDASNNELVNERIEAKELCMYFNLTSPKDKEKQNNILKKLLPNASLNIEILEPFHCDYGYNIYIGNNTFINHGAYLMDCGDVIIGQNTFIGPHCGIYTASHPLLSEERNKNIEIAKPITIGNNVWIGADVTILAGVTIGDNTVIGAKSLVTKDIPSNVIAVGNPCKVIRKITEKDSINSLNVL